MACQHTDDNQQQGAERCQQIGLQADADKEAGTEENQKIQIGPCADFVFVSVEEIVEGTGGEEQEEKSEWKHYPGFETVTDGTEQACFVEQLVEECVGAARQHGAAQQYPPRQDEADDRGKQAFQIERLETGCTDPEQRDKQQALGNEQTGDARKCKGIEQGPRRPFLAVTAKQLVEGREKTEADQ